MKRISVLPAAAFAAVCLFGFGLIASTVNDYIRLRDAQNWPSVDAEILSSKVGVGRSKSPNRTSYYAEIVYRYKSHGREYVGSTVRLGPNSENQSEAEALVARFPPGKAGAFVDPNDPESSVLDRSALGGTWYVEVIFGFGLMAIGALLSTFFWKAWREARTATPVSPGEVR